MNSYSFPTPAIISTHLSFGGDDHEGDRYRCDHDADDDVVGQGLPKDQGADQYGRDRLEYAQNGCLGGTDVTGGNGQYRSLAKCLLIIFYELFFVHP